MSSIICKKIFIYKTLWSNLFYTSMHISKKCNSSSIFNSIGLSSNVIYSKFSSKIHEETRSSASDSSNTSERNRNRQNHPIIEPTKYIDPYDITDDDHFEEKFWEQYKKKIRETKESYSSPYPEKIRYRKSYKNPYHRALGIIRDDILEYFGKLKHNSLVALRKDSVQSPYIQDEIFPENCDVLIIGGGIVGTSIAYHLQDVAKGRLRVIVVERDLSYSRASSVLSVGGIRQQFSTPENIVLSKYGMDFLQLAKKNLHTQEFGAPNISFTLSGYLTLASEEGYSQLVENYHLQKSLQSFVELLSTDQLKAKFPWIETDGIAAGVLGVQREGWIDPWDLLLSMNRKCKEFGVHFVNGTVTDSVVTSMADHIIGADKNSTLMRRAKSVNVTLPDGEVRTINFAAAIIASGAWSKDVGLIFGVGTGSGMCSTPIPVEPRKRYVYCFKSPKGPSLNCPLVIDPNGTYFRREGLADMYLCGASPTDGEEPSNDTLSVDESFFNNKIWPNIAHRCPSFENLKLQSSWAGYYDYNTLDQNAIIGLHPGFANLYMATGFSGHGIQHAPGAGKAITELVLEREFKSMNVERLGFERILLEQPIHEKCIY